MHPEIENLINMALADGEVTEKERGIILRKAEILGIDKDEVEMILDGKIALYNKQVNPISAPKSNKQGDLKKCPSCGAPVHSFVSKCGDCGHEFRNVEAVRSSILLSKLMNEAATKIKNEKASVPANEITNSNAHLFNPNNIAKEINVIQASIISSFPVPNTKEDLLEFISLAHGESNKIPNKLGGYVFDGSDILINAWKSKKEQILNKARIIFKDDQNSLLELEIYDNNKISLNKNNLLKFNNPFMQWINKLTFKSK